MGRGRFLAGRRLISRAGPPVPIRSSPCLRVSAVRIKRVTLAAAALAMAVTAVGALLQWFWAGWSVYSGPGPSPLARWLLTGAMGAALLLPPGGALVGAAVGRRLADPGLRDQLRVTQRGVARIAVLAGGWALMPSLLAILFSALGWSLVQLAVGAVSGQWSDGVSGLPALRAISTAHALVAVAAAALTLWGLALSVGRRGPTLTVHCLLPAAYCLLIAAPGLLGPLLPRLARPERAVNAALLVNPVTAVGAALGMDVLRSPHVYSLTRAPEYWYTYPPAAGVAILYLGAAALGGYRLRRQLEKDGWDDR
jgi:hypothetical protein